ncbi:MAG: DUF1540 domain-containing protein [Eubacteriales bacterium]|nr:DUF1540 domain-containing protein [Eubacteriales bacterium]
MNDKHGICCKVESCAHHCAQDHCDLASISVAPCCNCNSGKAEDESMCASYVCRG